MASQKTKDWKNGVSKFWEKVHDLEAKNKDDGFSFDHTILDNAIQWAAERAKTRRAYFLRDMFTENPSLIANGIIDYRETKATTEVLTAAILYPFLRPQGSDPVDVVAINDIANSFGHKVYRLLKYTLRLDALDKIDLEIEPTEDKDLSENAKKKLDTKIKNKKEEHHRMWLLMNLWVGTRDAPIFIIGITRLIALQHKAQAAIDRVGHRLPNDLGEQRSRDLNDAKRGDETIAPLVLLAGDQELYSDIRNATFRLKNPKAFEETSRQIATATRVLTPEEIEQNKKSTILRAEDFFGSTHPISQSSGHRPGTTKHQSLAINRPQDQELTVLKEEDLAHFRDQVHQHMRALHYHSDSYTLQLRDKEPYSTWDKASRKEQGVWQLGDLRGFRIILHASAVRDYDQKDESEIKEALADSSRKLYGQLSQRIGRGNNNAEYAAMYQRLAQTDPMTAKELEDMCRRIKSDLFEFINDSHSPQKSKLQERLAALEAPKDDPKHSISAQVSRLTEHYIELIKQATDPCSALDAKTVNPLEKLRKRIRALKTKGKCIDARPDNYYDDPKDNNYIAIHDTCALRHKNGALVEFEMQIVDEIQHDINMYDPETGWVIYKAQMQGKGYEVQEWQKYARAPLEENPSPRKDVIVYGERGQIYHVPGTTMRDYIKLVYGEEASRSGQIAVLVDNVDPFNTTMKRVGNINVRDTERELKSPDARLYNADSIKLLQLVA